jgi:putative transposase
VRYHCKYCQSDLPDNESRKAFIATTYGKTTRTHEEKIITLHSDTRWCSDAFANQCCNAERVHVVFSLDTCNREVMGYLSSTIGVDGAMVRDLLVEIVETRFGAVSQAPQKVQWLTDNGPCYTSNETVSGV